MHVGMNSSSSSHCAHGSEFEYKFTSMMREIKKRLWYNVSQVKFNFDMFILKCICMFINRKSELP
jgi:hypothetical protein